MTHPPSRRLVLGGALAGAAGAVPALVGAAPSYAAGNGKHDGPPLLSRPDRHLVTRFSYGLTPALARDVRKAGGAREWFDGQLKPRSVSDKEAAKVRCLVARAVLLRPPSCGSGRSARSRAAGR